MTQTLADAYLAALAMMQVTGPDDLNAAANFVARGTGERLDDSALRAYLSQVGPNDPLQMDLRLKLARWDHMGTDVAWADGTVPNTDDRRDVIVQRLRVDDETAHLLVTLFPVAGREDPVVIAAEWEPWYGEAVKAQRSFYWEHYSGYLAAERGWNPNAIAALGRRH